MGSTELRDSGTTTDLLTPAEIAALSAELPSQVLNKMTNVDVLVRHAHIALRKLDHNCTSTHQ